MLDTGRRLQAEGAKRVAAACSSERGGVEVLDELRATLQFHSARITRETTHKQSQQTHHGGPVVPGVHRPASLPPDCLSRCYNRGHIQGEWVETGGRRVLFSGGPEARKQVGAAATSAAVLAAAFQGLSAAALRSSPACAPARQSGRGTGRLHARGTTARQSAGRWAAVRQATAPAHDDHSSLRRHPHRTGQCARWSSGSCRKAGKQRRS